ncbi:MAG: hypothetical protein RL367_345 [Pseudomonadota bacterium]
MNLSPPGTRQTALPVIAASFCCSVKLAEVIADRAELRRYAPRDKLVEAGDAVQSAWLMIDGRAQEFALTVDGRTVLVHEFKPGDLFGEAVLLGQPVLADEVIAIELTDAARFATRDLIALIENYSCVALAYSRALTQRLYTIRRRMVEGATLSANGRIHAELLRQARATKDLTIRPAPVLSEFAMVVQTTRETVSRAISQLEKRGIIIRDAVAIKLVAAHRLEDLIR